MSETDRDTLQELTQAIDALRTHNGNNDAWRTAQMCLARLRSGEGREETPIFVEPDLWVIERAIGCRESE